MRLACLLLAILCCATASAQDPRDGYPELRQVEQRISELDRRL
jgi:hypothetical protein